MEHAVIVQHQNQQTFSYHDKNPCKSIILNCQKAFSWMKRPQIRSYNYTITVLFNFLFQEDAKYKNFQTGFQSK